MCKTKKDLKKKSELFSSLKSHEKLLPKLRLIVFSLALVHLVTIVVLLLSIDFAGSEIPEIRAYDEMRWKLITTWFNLLMLVYFPLCICCDWREVNGNMEGAWKTLNNIRNVMFTSILLPSIVVRQKLITNIFMCLVNIFAKFGVNPFGDLLFWRLYNKNKYFLMPKEAENSIPFWTQHSMHTISLFIVILDLVLTPRRRPKSLFPGLAITAIFVSSYEAVVTYAWYNGQYIYPFIGMLSMIKITALIIYILLEPCVYYLAQWLIIDYVFPVKSSKSQKKIL